MLVFTICIGPEEAHSKHVGPQRRRTWLRLSGHRHNSRNWLNSGDLQGELCFVLELRNERWACEFESISLKQGLNYMRGRRLRGSRAERIAWRSTQERSSTNTEEKTCLPVKLILSQSRLVLMKSLCLPRILFPAACATFFGASASQQIETRDVTVVYGVVVWRQQPSEFSSPILCSSDPQRIIKCHGSGGCLLLSG